MDPKTTGAWLVHHTQKLSLVTDANDFGKVRLSGKCGLLLSALSASDEIVHDKSKVDTLARAAEIDLEFELPKLLDTLAKSHLIDSTKQGVAVLGLSTSVVLKHTGDLFESFSPSPLERASIALAESCSIAPQDEARLRQQLGDEFHLDKKSLQRLLTASEHASLTDVERVKGNSAVYFNGNLFRLENPSKTKAIIGALSNDDSRRVAELDATLRTSGCVTIDDAERVLGHSLFSKLKSIGVYDVNVVSNSTESTGYVTRPSAFAKFGSAMVSDAFDLAKAFVASITYGMSRSAHSRGRIQLVSALMRKLIAGAWVGPATAIGEDYRILELKNVVQVRPDPDGRFYMKLLKREVGELALQVIAEGDASEQSLAFLPGAAITKFKSPETERVETRRHRMELGEENVLDLLQSLRTGGYSR